MKLSCCILLYCAIYGKIFLFKSIYIILLSVSASTSSTKTKSYFVSKTCGNKLKNNFKKYDLNLTHPTILRSYSEH